MQWASPARLSQLTPSCPRVIDGVAYPGNIRRGSAQEQYSGHGQGESAGLVTWWGWGGSTLGVESRLPQLQLLSIAPPQGYTTTPSLRAHPMPSSHRATGRKTEQFQVSVSVAPGCQVTFELCMRLLARHLGVYELLLKSPAPAAGQTPAGTWHHFLLEGLLDDLTLPRRTQLPPLPPVRALAPSRPSNPLLASRWTFTSSSLRASAFWRQSTFMTNELAEALTTSQNKTKVELLGSAGGFPGDYLEAGLPESELLIRISELEGLVGFYVHAVICGRQGGQGPGTDGGLLV